MMKRSWTFGALSLAIQVGVGAQPAPAASVPALAPGLLFAVEFKTGPTWDAAKPAQEQAEFRAHSANLKRLRDQGSLVLGARYADKGFVVLSAANEAEAHAMVQQDPSVKAGTFVYQLNEFRVFYGGAVAPPARKP